MICILLAITAYLLFGIWFWYACSAADPAPKYFVVAWFPILLLMLHEIMFKD